MIALLAAMWECSLVSISAALEYAVFSILSLNFKKAKAKEKAKEKAKCPRSLRSWACLSCEPPMGTGMGI